MTVPPPVIAANRTQLASLVATNFSARTPRRSRPPRPNTAKCGPRTPRQCTAMLRIRRPPRQVTPFTAAPQTTNPAGSAVQSAAVTQAAGTSAGNVTGVAVADLPGAAEPRNARLVHRGDRFGAVGAFNGIENVLGLTGTSAASPFGSIGESLIGELLYLPAFFGAFVGLDASRPPHGQCGDRRRPHP